MSCPSGIYTVVTNAAVTEGAQGPFGSIVRRFGRNVQLDGSGINLVGQGYYDLSASVNFVPTATGPVTVQFYQDGAAIPGASMTGQGTASTPMSMSFRALVRNTCCDPNSTITYTIDAAGTISNMPTVITKE